MQSELTASHLWGKFEQLSQNLVLNFARLEMFAKVFYRPPLLSQARKDPMLLTQRPR